MKRIILADPQAIFRAGAAKVLALDEDLRIVAQCADLERMHHAVTTIPGSIVLFAASLQPDLVHLRHLLETGGSRGIVIEDNSEVASNYLIHGFRGVISRSATGPMLLECVRNVAAGRTWMPPQSKQITLLDNDMVGLRVLDRLTPKEMRIVALIVRGYRNRGIASRLKTSEQVIKNYLRSIFNKTGVGDRLELAMFTIHHPLLAEAAAEVGRALAAEEQTQTSAVA